MDSIQGILGDSVVFVDLHIGLVTLVGYAIWRDRKMKRDMVSEKWS